MDVKIGDRVRLLYDDNCNAYERGDIVMVNEVDDDGVYFNDNDDDKRYLLFEDIEPVAVADSNGNLTIREGKFYRTRDGRKVGPTEVSDDYEYPWRASCALYLDNGRWLNDDIEDDNDIVAEWVDEPVAAGDSSNADIFDELEDWMADNPLPAPTPTTGFTVPLDAPEFANDNDEPDGKLQVCNLEIAYQMVQTGVCTINEVRKILGLPTIASGHHLAAA